MFFIFKKKKNTEFGSVEILSNSCILPVTSYDNLHRESKKKQDTKLMAITSLTIIRFSKFFH